MEKWQLQDAKNKFSEVVDRAIHSGPQVVTRRGVDTVVVLSVDDYRKLTAPESSIVDFFRQSPLCSAELDLERDKGYGREVEF